MGGAAGALDERLDFLDYGYKELRIPPAHGDFALDPQAWQAYGARACRPRLRRFLPYDEVRAASELLARTVLTFAFRPAAWIDPHDPSAVRRLVRTYLLPALAPAAPPPQENP